MGWHRLALAQRQRRTTEIGHRTRERAGCDLRASQRSGHAGQGRQEENQGQIELTDSE